MFRGMARREDRLHTRQELLAVPKENETLLERQQIGSRDPDSDVRPGTQKLFIGPEPEVVLGEMDARVREPGVTLVIAKAAYMIGMRVRADHSVDAPRIDPGADQVIVQTSSPRSEALKGTDPRLEEISFHSAADTRCSVQ